MNDTQKQTMAATFGVCQVCGAPRKKHTITEDTETGGTVTTVRMVCTEDWAHTQKPSLEEPWYP